MLVVTRHVGERIMIGSNVVVTVLGVNGNQVRLGVRGAKRHPRASRGNFRAHQTRARPAA